MLDLDIFDLLSIFLPTIFGVIVALLIIVFMVKIVAEATSVALKTQSLIHKRQLSAKAKRKARELKTLSYFGAFLGFLGVFIIINRNLPPAVGVICLLLGLFIFYQAIMGASQIVSGRPVKRPATKKGSWYIPDLDGNSRRNKTRHRTYLIVVILSYI